MIRPLSVPPPSSMTALISVGRRERIAACLVRADTRADVNHTVKRLLDVRRVVGLRAVALVPHSRRKKARRGGYIAAGFLSLSEERTFPPRNA